MSKLILLLMILLSFSLHAKTEKEYVVTYKIPPWETNEPYFDDYTKELDTQFDRLDEIDPVEFEKCQKIKNEFGKNNCLSNIRSSLITTQINRGSHTYVMNTYGELRATPRKLINVLKGLDEIRNKTRNVPFNDRRKTGELSYEMINNEICLIESNIGKLSRKSYCHSRRY